MVACARARLVAALLSASVLSSGCVLLGASVSGAASGRVMSSATVRAPGIAGCSMLPSTNVWNTPVTNLPVMANSDQLVAAIGASSPLHPDFGSGTWDGAPIGIPFTVVPSTQAGVSVRFHYASESDPGPYPIPANPKVEGGPGGTGDRHVLIVQRGTCKDFELFAAKPISSSTSWKAGSGAIFSMGSNALRPAGWTSADAAGLPILAGLARPGEVANGAINHALRITVPVSAQRYLWPARHEAGSASGIVPMGLRLRLKASVDISSFPASDQVILQALKTYGAIVADNGSPWYLSGVPSAAWNNDTLHLLTQITGSDFEAVDESCLQVSVNSGSGEPDELPCGLAPARASGGIDGRGDPRRLDADVPQWSLTSTVSSEGHQGSVECVEGRVHLRERRPQQWARRRSVVRRCAGADRREVLHDPTGLRC